jgi:hypothetical protein
MLSPFFFFLLWALALGRFRQVLAPVLVPGACSLDVGCGSGLVACAMAWLANGESFGDANGESFGDAHGESFGDAHGEIFGDAHGESFGDANGESFHDSSESFTGNGSGESFYGSRRRRRRGGTRKPTELSHRSWRCVGVDCEAAAVAFAARAAQSLCPAFLRHRELETPPRQNPSDACGHAAPPRPEQHPLDLAPSAAAAAAAGLGLPDGAAPRRLLDPSAPGETAPGPPPARGGGPRLQFVVANGWDGGGYGDGEFHAIHVGAAGALSWRFITCGVCSCC